MRKNGDQKSNDFGKKIEIVKRKLEEKAAGGEKLQSLREAAGGEKVKKMSQQQTTRRQQQIGNNNFGHLDPSKGSQRDRRQVVCGVGGRGGGPKNGFLKESKKTQAKKKQINDFP